MSIEVVTFGCRLNSHESDVIRSEAQKAGLQNAIIFNTCAVTAEATRQVRQAIRRERRKNTDAYIIVTGCAAQIEPDRFAAMDEVDQVIGNEEKLHAQTYRSLQKTVEHSDKTKIIVNDIMSVKKIVSRMAIPFGNRTRAVLQVQNGCDHRCTFCVIPYGRGDSRSVPMNSVINTAQMLVSQGYIELVIAGVDITSYGHDLPNNPSLGELTRNILNQIPKLKRLRLSSIDSIEADDALLHAFAEEERLMPHIHLSLQSGDNMILKRMKRRHTRSDTINFCEKMRRLRQNIVFGADIIAGFPTETNTMFDNSMNIVEECGLTFLHIFPFSARPNTAAARMPQIDRAIIRERASRLRDKGQQMLLHYLKAQYGTTCKVLLETRSMGRTEHYTPVLVEERQTDTSKITAGTIKNINITGHTETALTGTIA